MTHLMHDQILFNHAQPIRKVGWLYAITNYFDHNLWKQDAFQPCKLATTCTRACYARGLLDVDNSSLP